MKTYLYLVVKDFHTGELESFITTNSNDSVVLDARMVEIDFASNAEKLSSDLRDKYYFASGLLVAMPPKPSPHHIFNYDTKQWVANPDKAWADVRKQRDRLLTTSDWVVTKATESGQVVPSMWVAYRQALRDVTLQTDPGNIVWPVTPV